MKASRHNTKIEHQLGTLPHVPCVAGPKTSSKVEPFKFLNMKT